MGTRAELAAEIRDAILEMDQETVAEIDEAFRAIMSQAEAPRREWTGAEWYGTLPARGSAPRRPVLRLMLPDTE